MNMNITWEHKIFFVQTDRLVKYLEINIFETKIRFRYISKHIYEYVEKEQSIDLNEIDIINIQKFKNYIINFPKIEVLNLDINQLFIFFSLLLKE